jgi:hypothetical protein
MLILKPGTFLLVVEDTPIHAQHEKDGIMMDFELTDPELQVHVLCASSTGEAMQFVEQHGGAIIGIALDGCVDDADTYDTGWLIKWFRQNGITGPIISTSRNEEVRSWMLADGCTDACRQKVSVGQVLLKHLKK